MLEVLQALVGSDTIDFHPLTFGGDSWDSAQAACVVFSSRDLSEIMAPAKAMKAKKVAMKAMKGQKAMSKGLFLVSWSMQLSSRGRTFPRS